MSRARILIVDDEVGSSRLLKANLDLTGRYEVRVENDPESVISMVRQFRPDLIVMDLIMPRLSGASLVATLQADPELKHIRCLFLTAAAGSLLTEETAKGLCRFPCILKPASVEDIIRQIDSLYRNRSAEG